MDIIPSPDPDPDAPRDSPPNTGPCPCPHTITAQSPTPALTPEPAKSPAILDLLIAAIRAGMNFRDGCGCVPTNQPTFPPHAAGSVSFQSPPR
jgi:hypothetical protein